MKRKSKGGNMNFIIKTVLLIGVIGITVTVFGSGLLPISIASAVYVGIAGF